MLSIRDDASMARALAQPIDPELRDLLQLRWEQLRPLQLGMSVHFVVVQPGDSLPAIETEVGFPISTNFVDGTRFGDADFTPSWEWVTDHRYCNEMAFVLSDDGSGAVLFIEKRAGVEPELLAHCARYAS